MWPTPKGTDADRGGRGDLIQAVRGNQSPSGHFRSPSDPSSRASAALTSDSSAPVCALCGSASRTSSAEGSLPGTGPESRAIPTCAPLWPTPSAYQDQRPLDRFRQTPVGKTITTWNTLTMALKAVGEEGWCPCVCHRLTSSAAAFPVRTSASPVAGPDWPENARVFGGSSQGSLGNYDPATSSLRTSQLSLLEDSTSSLRTLPRAGSMRNGTIYRRRPLAPLTDATASGSLPTPAAVSYGSNQGGAAGRVGPVRHSLESMARHNLWPTPKASDSSRDPSQATRWGPGNSQRSNLKDALRYRQSEAGEPTTGSLNPTWVEWLMGFPLGWTDCEHSETRSSPKSPSGSEGRSSSGS